MMDRPANLDLAVYRDLKVSKEKKVKLRIVKLL